MATKHVTHNGHKVFHNRGSQTPIKEHFPLQQISATKCSTTVALRHQKRNTFHLSHFQTPPRDHTMSLASTTFAHTQSGTVAVLGLGEQGKLATETNGDVGDMGCRHRCERCWTVCTYSFVRRARREGRAPIFLQDPQAGWREAESSSN